MSAKALKYAEDNLGVHTVYDEALSLRGELDGVFTDLDKAQDQKRQLVDEVADREADLLSDERGKHSDMSATALAEHMKVIKRKDTFLHELRSKLSEVSGAISGMEYDADLLKLSIKIKVARLEELGGYLHYLAVLKEAETITKRTQPTQPTQSKE